MPGTISTRQTYSALPLGRPELNQDRLLAGPPVSPRSCVPLPRGESLAICRSMSLDAVPDGEPGLASGVSGGCAGARATEGFGYEFGIVLARRVVQVLH